MSEHELVDFDNWEPNWKPDCGGDLDSYTEIFRLCIFSSPGRHPGSIWLYMGDAVIRQEDSDSDLTQPEQQVWGQNKGREWLVELHAILVRAGFITAAKEQADG